MRNGDRNAFASSAVPSLAEVAVRIGAIEQISAARKAAIRSAINTASRWFRLPATAIPAHPEFLRRLFAGFSPAAVGATPKRVSNVKSDLLFALRRLGLLARGSYLAPFAPEWQALWGRLPDQYARTTLSRFFRYCSAQGVHPVLVTDEVAASFLTALETETLVKQPRVVHQNVARLWNRMRAQVAGWPAVELTVPRYADHYILPESAFPASFRRDLDAFIANLGHADILNLDAPPRALRPRTLTSYRYELRRFASMLVHSGHPAARITSLAYLVQPKHVEDGLRFLLARHGNKPVRTGFDLAILLGKVAKHWVKAPPETVSLIRRYAQLVRPRVEGLSTRNRRRLAPLRDERNLARLFLLPGKIRKKIEGKSQVTCTDALLMQHAVALMILTYAPVRVGTLARLCLENLRWSGPDMTGTLVLDIDGGDVKNGQTLSFPLPADCADLVRVYLRSYQPQLVRAASPYVFPSDVPGRPKRADTLGKQLSRLIRRSIGLEVNPHLYRHLVHIVVLNRYPGAYAMISRILGHKSLQTAISNYAGEDIAIAMRAFHELIADTIAGRTRGARPDEVASSLDPMPRKRRA